MSELYRKMIDEAMAAQRADVGMVKKKRGQAFVIDDAKVYLDAVKKMKAVGDQSKAVFLLHTESVKAHFESLEALTKTVRPEDDPFVEHYQTPVVMEILYDQDPQFRKSIDGFVEAIGKSEALVGKEAARRYSGSTGRHALWTLPSSPAAPATSSTGSSGT